MTRPTFLVIGAMKAGTTSLHRYLAEHPDVYMAPEKEPHFFVAEGTGTWGRGLSWYESLFDGAGEAIAVGEASTGYTMFPHVTEVPERIAAVLPDARLVYVLRQPVERMRSHYVEELSRGEERRPLGEALLTDARYVDASRYALQLERFLDVFDRRQLLVVTAERLRADPGGTLDDIAAFVGVVPGWRPDPVVLNPTRGKTVPRPPYRWLGGAMIRTGLTPTISPTLQRRLDRVGRRPLAPADTTLPADVADRLVRALRPDLERLRLHVGSGFDCWGLA